MTGLTAAGAITRTDHSDERRYSGERSAFLDRGHCMLVYHDDNVRRQLGGTLASRGLVGVIATGGSILGSAAPIACFATAEEDEAVLELTGPRDPNG